MPVSEITVLTTVVIETARALHTLGNNWYEASAAWDDLPLKIEILKEKWDIWDKAFKDTGMLSDPSFLMETLEKAKALLEKERAKVERGQENCYARCGSKMCMAIFPKQVGVQLQLVINTFDAIAELLQFKEEATVTTEKVMMRTVPSLPFREDDRYVLLKDTEDRVRIALDDPLGPPLVLLHGAAGKGKSTLAGHVALEYRSKCKEKEARFELVVFLECGPKAELTNSQLKLLQLLGSSAIGAPSPQEQGQTSSVVSIKKQLSGRLKNQKILIIFDDVSSLTFLQEMSNLCGGGVKCLVTSQERHLCDGLSSTRRPISIQIEDVQLDVAMEILASHVGFRDKKIPQHIQRQALKFIESTASNPLALASVGRAIENDRCDELTAWEAAYGNIFTILQSDDTACVLGQKYPESFWSATVSSIQSLREEAQKLLILLYMCDDTLSVPEEVLQILYFSAIFKDGSQTFEQSRKHLASRGLDVLQDSLRRIAIEPVTRLLGLYESDRWTKAAKSFAKQIFLHYVYDSVLHNDGILNLVALPISVLPMLRALEGIATVESETTLIGGNSENLIKALVDLLGVPSDTGDITRVTSARIFHRLSLNNSHCGVIRSLGISEVLVKLSEDSNVDLQNTAALILRNLETMNTEGTPECSSGYTNETPECSSVGHNNETPQCSGAGYTNETPQCRGAGYTNETPEFRNATCA